MTRNFWILLSATYLLLACNAVADTRVAVVGSSDSDSADGVIALAEATLTSRDGIVILERQQIDAIFREQQLNLSGMVDTAKVIEIGRLLAVDLFAFVEQSKDGKESLSCIVYDAGTGVRLRDESLSGDNLKSNVRDVVACVEAAVKKRSAGLDKLKTLSVVSVRNADLPRSVDTQCQSLGMLLERGFVGSRNIAVLERTRLAWLQQEQNLTATASDGQLLSSVLQADLEFSRCDDGVQATLLVRDAAGQEIHRVLATAATLNAQLVTKLVVDVERKLDSKPALVVFDQARESQRYFREAQLRMSFGETKRAVQAAEASSLLGSGEPRKTLLLANYLFKYARELNSGYIFEVKSGKKRAIPKPLKVYRDRAQIGDRAIDLFCHHFHQMAPDTPAKLSAYRKLTFSTHGAFTNFCGAFPEYHLVRPDDLSQFKQLRLKTFTHGLQISKNELDVYRNLAKTDSGAMTAYSHSVGGVLTSIFYHETRDPKHATVAALEILNEWLEQYERFPINRRPYRGVGSALRDITGRLPSRHGYSDLLMPTLERLAQHPDPMIQLHGRRGIVFASLSDRDLEKRMRVGVQGFRPIRKDVTDYLAQPANEQHGAIRDAMYDFLHASLHQIAHSKVTGEMVNELHEICEPMFARNELHSRLAAGWQHYADVDAARAGLAIVDRALELYGSAKRVALGGKKRPLEEARMALLTQWPELRTKDSEWKFEPRFLAQSDNLRSSSLIVHPLVRNENVYAVMQDPSRSPGKSNWQSLKIATIPIAGGSQRHTKSVDINVPSRGSHYATRIVTASCFHKAKIYVTSQAGIVEFDLETDEARFVMATPSFPTQVAQSIASYGGRLYAGLEGGYVVSFTPEDKECVIVASSRRKQAQTKLDDSEAFDVQKIIPDVDRERLLLHVTHGHINTGTGELWEYFPRTNRFGRLLEFSKYLDNVSNVQQGRTILSQSRSFVSLDLATNSSFVVSSYPLGPNLVPDRDQFLHVNLNRPVECVGRLWSPAGQSLTGILGTVSLNGDDEQKLIVDLPPLTKNEIFAGWYVAPVDEKRFLWSNHHRLWLVTPQLTSAATKN